MAAAFGCYTMYPPERSNMCWNLINSLPPPPRGGGGGPEEERKRAEVEHQHREAQAAAAVQHQQQQAAQVQQQRLMAVARERERERERERAYYPQTAQVQRPASVPNKVEYPPPAHSRIPGVKSSGPEKPQPQQSHTALPKAEPNFNLFGYPTYQTPLSFMQQHHDPNKVKQEPKSVSNAVISPSLVVTKGLDREREMILPNPPPLMSDLKNSVIVKNEGKSPQSVESAKPLMAHSPSPKMRVSEAHYLPPSSSASQHKSSPYEYRSPSQSPHPLSHPHTPSPLHQYEGQNLASISKVHNVPAMHHRARQSPHPPPHRQSPHPQHPPQPHHRHSPHSHPHRQSPHQQHPHPSPPSTVVYTKQATVGSYPYPSPLPQMQHYVPQVTTPPKPKVSSPAPPHIYGKPSGITSGTPVCRPQEVTLNPLALATKPPLTTSPYHQLSQHNPPPPIHTVPTTLPPPPAAHSSINRTSSVMFDPRLYPPTPPGLAVSVKPPPNSPPSRSSPLHFNPGPHIAVTPAVQKEPLDLGMSSIVKEEPESNPCSPKRKNSEEPESLDFKKIKVEVTNEPVLSRVSEPSPLLASAATTITTVVNTAVAENLEPLSGGGAPGTPVPCPSPAKPGSGVDSEKSNSPGPRPVHKLKKAWLQRHSGEDGTDDKDVVGSGSCVTLPLTLPKKEPESVSVVSSLHSIGSMAVNSISKTKTKGNSRKVSKENSSSGGGSGNSGLLNGHVTPVKIADADDSSSSDPDRKSTPLKRVPPKVKRKKGGVRKTMAEEVKRKKLSASSTDSEKESGSEKESDSGQGQPGKKATGRTESEKGTKDSGRKRGRRPKSNANSTSSSLPKNEGGEEPRGKKSKEEPPAPFQKPPIAQLKKTGESFLQDGPCFEVAPKLAKCRECRWTPNQRSRNMPNIFCRFYAFRRLRYTKNGQLAIAGFSDPHRDATQDDLKLWLPMPENPPDDLDPDMSKFLLRQIGDQFCDLLKQEEEALFVHMSEEKTIAWKRVVQGVREMCDVCETTLFNYHWACSKCGFVVCIDCYKGRKNGASKMWGEPGRDRDDLSWLFCTNRQPHEQEKLMLTQIIAGDSLKILGRKVHESRAYYGLEMKCGCPLAKTLNLQIKRTNGVCKDLVKHVKGEPLVNGQVKADANKEKKVDYLTMVKKDASTLKWLADVALSNEEIKEEEEDSSSDSEPDDSFSTLRELLIRPTNKKSNCSREPSPSNTIDSNNTDKEVKIKNSNNNSGSNGTQVKPESDDSDDTSNVEQIVKKENGKKRETENKEKPSEVRLKTLYKKLSKWEAQPLPARFMTLTLSQREQPDLPHTWLNEGKLLHLLDSEHPGNHNLFQEQWKRGQPVIVSDVTNHLDASLWQPDSFAKDFGDTKNDLVNCITGNVIPLQPMRKFWEGFDHYTKRMKDDEGLPMVLKLKDWPPGEDFAEMLPSRYNDLMKVLPLGEYTQRQGRLNLASRLPDCFVRPDLGPKMYTAYGAALYPDKGTTNLHLDISDAVNVMVYVSIPKDADTEEHMKESYRTIDESGCDIFIRKRVREQNLLPGALWHIYAAKDADKIRDLLNKVALERGSEPEPHHDPIHDQSWYLDVELQERLYSEYGVKGYAIVQCMGDALFIPAGAPHQVRNLHNCIKVAEDFVSPENVSECFRLTQEFRNLTDTHSNHEDKLQIKNIMYHAVKDSLSVLGAQDTDSKFASDLFNDTSIKSEPLEDS